MESKYLPKGAVGKAVCYALNAEPYIRNYLLDVNLEISNNRAERAIKPFITGRKNFLFSNTKNGAKGSSILYSIVESAKMNNLKLFEYLVYVLNTLSTVGLKDDIIKKLLPYSKQLPEELYLKESQTNHTFLMCHGLTLLYYI